jgi:hypothetical protein
MRLARFDHLINEFSQFLPNRLRARKTLFATCSG